MTMVVLYDLKQPAIIVKSNTGIVYTNQTNGVACNHPSQEGFLIPLRSPDITCKVFNPHYWYENMPALDDTLYDALEESLTTLTFWNIRDIRVDRTAKNEEAWVHVKFRGDLEQGSSFFAGGFASNPDKVNLEEYPLYEGILTWENCD